VLDSPIDLKNLVNLCEGTEKRRVITKRQVKGKQVMVACGHLAAGCPRLNNEDKQQNDPSSQAFALWYEALPTPRKDVIDGRLDGTVLTAEAYEGARARAEADLLGLALSLYPERDEVATDGETTGNSEGGGRQRDRGATQQANPARPPQQRIPQPASKQHQAKAKPRTRSSTLARGGRTVRRASGRISSRVHPLDAHDSDALTDGEATDSSADGGRDRVHFADQPAKPTRQERQPVQQPAAKQHQAQAMPRTRPSVLSKVGRTVRRASGRSSARAIPLEA
jgi:hypothetical protein